MANSETQTIKDQALAAIEGAYKAKAREVPDALRVRLAAAIDGLVSAGEHRYDVLATAALNAENLAHKWTFQTDPPRLVVSP